MLLFRCAFSEIDHQLIIINLLLLICGQGIVEVGLSIEFDRKVTGAELADAEGALLPSRTSKLSSPFFTQYITLRGKPCSPRSMV